jgi:hypothetical protein
MKKICSKKSRDTVPLNGLLLTPQKDTLDNMPIFFYWYHLETAPT